MVGGMTVRSVAERLIPILEVMPGNIDGGNKIGKSNDEKRFLAMCLWGLVFPHSQEGEVGNLAVIRQYWVLVGCLG